MRSCIYDNALLAPCQGENCKSNCFEGETTIKVWFLWLDEELPEKNYEAKYMADTKLPPLCLLILQTNTEDLLLTETVKNKTSKNSYSWPQAFLGSWCFPAPGKPLGLPSYTLTCFSSKTAEGTKLLNKSLFK